LLVSRKRPWRRVLPLCGSTSDYRKTGLSSAEFRSATKRTPTQRMDFAQVEQNLLMW